MPPTMFWDFTGFPNLTKLVQGKPFSHNVRQHLFGPKSAKALIRIVQFTGNDPRACGWRVDGDFLKWDGSKIGTGTFKLEAIV